MRKCYWRRGGHPPPGRVRRAFLTHDAPATPPGELERALRHCRHCRHYRHCQQVDTLRDRPQPLATTHPSTMPDDAATPLYEAQQDANPLPVHRVSSNREHEVTDISARTASRLAIGMTAAAMAMAGTVAVMHSDSVSKTVSNLLANVSLILPPPPLPPPLLNGVGQTSHFTLHTSILSRMVYTFLPPAFHVIVSLSASLSAFLHIGEPRGSVR
jgi:hypothetical protein